MQQQYVFAKEIVKMIDWLLKKKLKKEHDIAWKWIQEFMEQNQYLTARIDALETRVNELEEKLNVIQKDQ